MCKAFRAFWVNGIERLPIGRVKERSSRRNAVAPIRQGDTNAAAKHVGGGGLRLTSVHRIARNGFLDERQFRARDR